MDTGVTPFAFTPNDSLGYFALLVFQFWILRVNGLNPKERSMVTRGYRKGCTELQVRAVTKYKVYLGTSGILFPHHTCKWMCPGLRRIKLPRIEQLSNKGYFMGEQEGPTQVVTKGEGNLEWMVEEEVEY